MALTNPCNLEATVVNTGSECDDAMNASAMIMLVPKDATWDDDDLDDFTGFLQTQIHATGRDRFLPIFGTSAPIRNIIDSKEEDVKETMEDGSVQFVRYGMYNRTFLTDKGGFCLAAALIKLGKNFSFIEVDINGKVAQMVNADGTYSGFPLNLGYAPTPDLATLKTVYKNAFMVSFSPKNYIEKGKVFASDADEDILSLRGLFDTEVFKAPATVQTITTIFVGVKTLCAETDLVAKYGATLAAVGNFVVTKVSDGSVVVPSAAAVVNGEIRLTGTFVSGQSYYVALAAASVLKTAGIVGYEGTKKATVPIP